MRREISAASGPLARSEAVAPSFEAMRLLEGLLLFADPLGRRARRTLQPSDCATSRLQPVAAASTLTTSIGQCAPLCRSAVGVRAVVRSERLEHHGLYAHVRID